METLPAPRLDVSCQGDCTLASNTIPSVAPPSTAQLVIHAPPAPDQGQRYFESALRRLSGLHLRDLRSAARVPLTIRIDDLRGRQVFACDNAAPLLTVLLPAGIYLVTTQLGSVRRKYSLALRPGATFDLYLRPTADQSGRESVRSPDNSR